MNTIFDKFFPSFGKKNVVYYNIISVFRTIIHLFNNDVDEKLNRDV